MNDCNFTGSSSVTTLQPTMCCAAAYTSILLVFPSGQRGLRPIYIDAHLQAPLIPPGRHVRTSASGRDRSTGHSHRSQGGEDDHMGRLHCEQKLEVSCGVTSEHPYNVLELGAALDHCPLPLGSDCIWVGQPGAIGHHELFQFRLEHLVNLGRIAECINPHSPAVRLVSMQFFHSSLKNASPRLAAACNLPM